MPTPYLVETESLHGKSHKELERETLVFVPVRNNSIPLYNNHRITLPYNNKQLFLFMSQWVGYGLADVGWAYLDLALGQMFSSAPHFSYFSGTGAWHRDICFFMAMAEGVRGHLYKCI